MTRSRQPMVKVQLELHDLAMQRLQRLRSATEASSYAEVVRRALPLLEDVDAKVRAGSEFFVREADGSLTPFPMFPFLP